MDRVNWMLILTGEVVQALEDECLKKFQVRFVVLHRLRLSPWAYASLPLANHWAFSTRLWFLFPFCLCGLSVPCGDLERSLTRLCGESSQARRLKGGVRPSGSRVLCFFHFFYFFYF